MTSTPAPKAAQRSRSWVDALVALIERLPGSPWAFYAIVTAFFVIGSIGLRWLDGSKPLGVIEPLTTVYALLTVYGLVAIHFLNRAAERSLDAFRPALGQLEPDYGRLRRDLTSMPQWAAVLGLVFGVVIQAVGALSSPTGWGITGRTSLLTDVFTVIQEDIFGVFLCIFILRAIGQLRMIVYIHRSATNIKLYENEPHTAFSRFTFATSIVVTVPYALAQVLAGLVGSISLFEVVLLIAVFATSVALFVLPLNGMHSRLTEEKSRLISESDRRFEATAAKLHERIETDRLEDVDSLTKAMSGLGIESDRLKKISTWPWRAQTLRGFLSSIALPVLLWAITTWLSRVFA